MRKTIISWSLVALLVAAAIFATGLVNRNVYSKAEVDTKVEHMSTVDDMRWIEQRAYNSRVEGKVDDIYKHLIGESDDAD